MNEQLSASEYRCPGEAQPISRAVHLARLASGFPGCLDCSQRFDAGSLPEMADVAQLAIGRNRSLRWRDGIRGVYRNELNRQLAAQWAAAFASTLDAAAPLETETTDGSPVLTDGPVVIVGHDHRPSSPDVAMGVVQGLRRMGCHVLDVGLIPEMVWQFAIPYHSASGGLYVAGSGCPASWTGLEFLRRGGVPVEQITLNEIDRRHTCELARPSHRVAGYETIWPTEHYLASRRSLFHALRPLKIVMGCSSQPVIKLWAEIFAPLPCKLQLIELPTRDEPENGETHPDAAVFAKTMGEHQAHLGLIVDETGRGLHLFDERGNIVSFTSLVELVLQQLLPECGHRTVVHPQGWSGMPPMHAAYSRVDWRTTSDLDAAAVPALMSDLAASLGWDSRGRIWFGSPFLGDSPDCGLNHDALLTTAILLQRFSQTDAVVSAIVAGLEKDRN